MNLGWFGVPTSGGSNGVHRLKPGLQAVRGCMVPMHGHKPQRLSMNLGCVGQTFLSAGSGDFPVARSRNTGQECPVNPQAGKPALPTGPGSWSQCIRKNERGLSMNRNSQTRITNDEIQRNTEILMTNEPFHTSTPFDIRASDFFRHLSFVICHSTTGSWSQGTASTS